MRRHLLAGLPVLVALFTPALSFADIAPTPGDDPCLQDPTSRACGERNADSPVYIHEAYREKLRTAEMVTPLTSGLFGDEVSLYNGATELSVTDISIPGNNDLRVELRRTFKVESRRSIQMLGGFGSWDIDVPHLYGIFDSTHKWNTGQGGSTKRCSSLWYPQSSGSGPHEISQVWSGNMIHLPGQGDREILYIANDPAQQKPANGGPYPWAARDDIRFYCKPTTSNGYFGEGFIAIDGEGTRYTFDVGMDRSHGALSTSTELGSPKHNRTRVYLMASRVQDRFGNWVNYTWSGEQLTRIESSDGRRIDIFWTNGTITKATAHLREWSYVYTNQALAETPVPWLHRVILPDLTEYSYSFSGKLRPTYLNDVGNGPGCPMSGEAAGNFTLVAKHPAGATGTFAFNYLRHYRGGIPASHCESTGGPSNETWFMSVGEYSDVYSLTAKTITGPGLIPQQWTYGYGSPPDKVRVPNLLACTGTASDLVRFTSVQSPDKSKAIHRFGVQHGCNDGRLLGVQTTATDGFTILRTETNTYVTEAEAPSMPFPNLVGNSSASQDPATSRVRPIKQRTINQQGVNFNWMVEPGPGGFDKFARPLVVNKSSFLGQKKEITSYWNAYGPWVVGQLSGIRVDEGDTTRWPLGRLFDNTTNKPKYEWSFGKLVYSRTYHGDGQINTTTDPGGQKTTTFDGYWRGIAQFVSHPDGSTESAIVNDHGEITSVTDAMGFTTTYEYDPMGRLRLVKQPVNDTTAWAQTVIDTKPINVVEHGLPPGHWRQTVTTGNYRKEIYLDGFWRPVLTREYDAASQANTRRVVQRRFDHENRETFASYPRRDDVLYNTPDLAGTSTAYDGLGRVLTVQASSELNPSLLKTTYEYTNLLGQTRITDPRNLITTIRYQAFDQPSTDAPVLVQTSAGTSTVITRDPFGNPKQINRSGLWNGATLIADRRFVYDEHKRLCKTYDPELGWTIMDYDGSNNIAWTANQALSSLTDCQRGSVIATNKSTRSYDARNRLLVVDHPVGTDDVTHTYFTDGALKSIATPNGGTWNYTYNKRRLLSSEILTANGLSLGINHGYTNVGHHSVMTYPDGSVLSMEPDALGQPTRVGSYATNVIHDPRGGIASFTYGNGITHSQTYNTRGLPASRQESHAGTKFMAFEHAYDRSGNLVGRLDSDGGADQTRSMGYDLLNRLTWSDAPGLLGTSEYTYDPLDNLRSVDFGGFGRVAQLLTYHYDANNRLYQRQLSVGNDNAFYAYGYDASGNMTKRDTHTHTFDRANRMLSSVTPNASESYRYDGHGRRTAIVRAFSTTTQLYTRDGKLIYERAPNGTATKHIYLGNRIVATHAVGVTFYQHTDHLGSVVRRTNGGRVTVGETLYEPYGSTANGAYEQRPGFTGHMTDAATTLSYMQQRYYDPVAMRFLSVDPAPVSTTDGANFNRYWYANNNPYRYVDPDGRRAAGKDTGLRLERGEYGGYIGAMNQARSFTRSQVDAIGPSQANRNDLENTLVRDANRVVDMANRSGDRNFIRALNSVSRLIIDGRSAYEATGRAAAVAYTNYAADFIGVIVNPYFSLGSHERSRKFVHEVFHKTPAMEAIRAANPKCGWGCDGSHEHATEAASWKFMGKWWDPSGGDK